MTVSQKWRLYPLWIVSLAVFVAHCATVPTGPLGCEGIQIRSEELTIAEAEAYCCYAVGERKKVEEFWGATWAEPIRIHVSSAYRISRALVPGHYGNRGFMEMPLRGVREHTGPLLHEIVHMYAPHENRFLAEGLAVYLHARLVGNPAFPNFGGDLGQLARRSLSGLDSLQVLNSVRTPRPLGSIMNEKAAYTLAGSFVGFLIERYGLPMFRRFYDMGNYEAVYGKSLQTLEQEWRVNLQGQ